MIVVTLAAAARTLVIAAAALALARPVAQVIESRPRRRLALMMLVLVPFLTPSLLTGYGWANFALSLIRFPALNEAGYALLLLLRLTPVAVLVIAFGPASPLSPSAIHCARLLGPHPRLSRLVLTLRGPRRNQVAAFAIVFLLAFADFELASLLATSHWTVRLFDAQTGGLSLTESLRLGLTPAAVQAAVAVGLGALLVSSSPDPGRPAGPCPGPRAGWFAQVYLVVAPVITTLLPAALAFRGMASDPGILIGQATLFRDILSATVFALAAAAGAWIVAGWLAQFPRLALLACLPGLFGALQVGLLLLSIFQLPLFRVVSDTCLPLLIGLIVVGLPFALALNLLLRVVASGTHLHLTRLLRTSPQPALRQRAAAVARTVFGRGVWGAVFFLFWLSYLEVSASTLLAPVAMTPVFGRLYNLMHYGRSDALSAMLAVAVAVPLLLLLILHGGLVLVERARINSGGPRERGLGSLW